MKVFISNNQKNLAAKLAEFQITATVEAEYGDDVVEGSAITLAHHGPRKGNQNPCLEPNFITESWTGESPQAIGISHIDLDCLGGVAAIMGKKPGLEPFWKLAAWVDSNGPHRAADHPAYNDCKDKLNAYYAFADANRYWPPKDGSVADVTELIEKSIIALTEILDGIPRPAAEVIEIMDRANSGSGTIIPNNPSSWIEKGREWFKRLRDTEERSLIDEGRIRIFASDQFCSAFYRNSDGTMADATVVYNTKSGAISLAFEDGGKRWNAAKILQDLFGQDAGGHAGIAGSPRGKRMNFADFNSTVVKIREVLNG